MAIKRPPRPSPEIPLTSTADVAFLLLVFFLVAASNQSDTGKLMDLPGTIKSAPTQSNQTVELFIRPNIYAVGDEVLPKNADLTAVLRKRLGGRKTPAERVVLVTADGNVDYQRWSDALAAVEAAGGLPAPQVDEGGGRGRGTRPGDAPAPDAAPPDAAPRAAPSTPAGGQAP